MFLMTIYFLRTLKRKTPLDIQNSVESLTIQKKKLNYYNNLKDFKSKSTIVDALTLENQSSNHSHCCISVLWPKEKTWVLIFLGILQAQYSKYHMTNKVIFCIFFRCCQRIRCLSSRVLSFSYVIILSNTVVLFSYQMVGEL